MSAASKRRIVVPALAAFRPDLIIVPCGFDAGFQDPPARMMLTSASYRRMAEMIRDNARTLCGGRLVLLHEAGYSVHSVPFLVLAVVEALSGQRTEVVDPFLAATAFNRYNALQSHQADVIEEVSMILASLKKS